MQVSATLHNGNLRQILTETPKAVIKKGMKAAATAGGTPMLKQMRQAVPVDTGTLLLSLQKKVKSYSGTGAAVCIIGAAKDVSSTDAKGHRRVPANYLHLVEGGHKGPHPAPAHPFMDKVYEATKDLSAEKMKAKLAEVVAREMAKR